MPPQLIAIGLITLFFIIVLFGYMTGNVLVHIGVAALPFLILLLNNPGSWFVLVLALDRSGLIFPGLPQGLQVVDVMMAGFVGLMIARSIIVKPPRSAWTWSDYFLLALVAVLVLTVAVRGFGIRALGGHLWGGMVYVKLFIAAGFLITARQVTLTARQLKMSILLMLALSFLPAVAQLVFTLSRGAIYQQYMFVHAAVGGLLGSLDAYEGGAGVVRFQLFTGVSASLFLAALILFDFKGVRRVPVILLLACAVGLAAYSGFRGSIIGIGVSLAVYILLISRENRLSRILQLGLVGAVALAVMIPFMQHMPAPIQRAVSFIPFLEISPHVLLDAEYSSQWRLDVWRLAWAEVPRYLWVGKGFAFDPAVTMSISVRMDSVLSAFYSHNYHSGPLTLLLDLGIMGLIAGSGFLIFSTYELIKKGLAFPDHPFLRRCYMAFLARYVYLVIAFFFIYGDAQEFIVRAIVTVALLNAIHRTAVRATSVPDESLESELAQSRPISPAFGMLRGAGR